MNVGTAQLNITPQPGIDLAGFAIRPQPSTGTLDPLWVRALYLQEGSECLLWLHFDLLALDQRLATEWRCGLARELNVPVSRILFSASHTHSGPAAIQLTGCGEVQPAYLAWLHQQVQAATRAAMLDLEPCRVRNLEGQCRLGLDRRESNSAHTDPRVGVVAWQRPDNGFKAVFVDYGMHPVCLRTDLISGDWPGEVARVMEATVPGRPLTLVSSGACGNINPPAVGVTADQMREWSREIVDSVGPLLERAGPANGKTEQPLRVAARSVPLATENWSTDDINRYAAGCLADPAGKREFGEKLRHAVHLWRTTMITRLERGEPASAPAELTAIWLGNSAVVGVNAEIFSRFTELAESGSSRRVHTVNCANGMIGYLPTFEAYAEGAYEVLWSMLFYNMPRPRKGGLEQLAEAARKLIG